MLHARQPEIQELLLKGSFGLEEESLRVTREGYMAHTRHPFSEPDIVRDFCENQTEINTPVFDSAREAVEALGAYRRQIIRKLNEKEEKEYLWPFSNPPYIRNEDDIPVAQFEGSQKSKTEYRNYLSDRYGRYKMTLSGIHVNFSFDEELLRRDFALSGENSFRDYKDQLYVTLAKRCAAYGWILVAVTAASPVMDASYVEKGSYDTVLFHGMGSVRCSELGYWNFFAAIFDYANIRSYADSIQNYVDQGLLRYAAELYYPIRLKPEGSYSLDTLRDKGVNHLELRMFDLNPLVSSGVELRDVQFAHLLLVWLASTPDEPFDEKDQVQAVQNFKNAAHYDLKTVKIVVPNGGVYTVTEAALRVLHEMKEFYRDYPQEIQEILQFQEEKFIDGDNRYAWKIRKEYQKDYVHRGLELAKKRLEEAYV